MIAAARLPGLSLALTQRDRQMGKSVDRYMASRLLCTVGLRMRVSGKGWGAG